LAIDAYKNAIQHYLDDGQFSHAAKLHEEIAEMMSEDGKYDESIQQYEKAIDLFETENDKANADKRVLIIAHMCAKVQKYDRAIKLFEKSAKYNADNGTLRWNVKTLVYKAMLCQLNYAAEKDDAKLWKDLPSVLQQYRSSNDLFAKSDEYLFCAVFVDALPNCDVEKIQTALARYDNLVTADAWFKDQVERLQDYIGRKKHAAPDLNGDIDQPDFSGDQPNASKDQGAGAKPSEIEEKDDKDFVNAPEI